MVASERWQYSGDVSLEYGGAYIDLSTFDDGYCSAVRITDLDSECGFTGAVMIEHVVICGTDDSKRIRQALHSCGYSGSNWHRLPAAERKANLRWAIADALMSYGYTDPDDSWDGYASYHTEIVQLDPNGPMRYDGWKADKRLRGGDLRGYVESVHLRD